MNVEEEKEVDHARSGQKRKASGLDGLEERESLRRRSMPPETTKRNVQMKVSINKGCHLRGHPT